MWRGSTFVEGLLSAWFLPILPPVSLLILQWDSETPPAFQPVEAEGSDYISPQRADQIDTESLFNPIQS